MSLSIGVVEKEYNQLLKLLERAKSNGFEE